MSHNCLLFNYYYIWQDIREALRYFPSSVNLICILTILIEQEVTSLRFKLYCYKQCIRFPFNPHLIGRVFLTIHLSFPSSFHNFTNVKNKFCQFYKTITFLLSHLNFFCKLTLLEQFNVVAILTYIMLTNRKKIWLPYFIFALSSQAGRNCNT